MFNSEKGDTWRCEVCSTSYAYSDDLPGLMINTQLVCGDCMDSMPSSYIDDLAFGKTQVHEVVPKWRKYRSAHQKP